MNTIEKIEQLKSTHGITFDSARRVYENAIDDVLAILRAPGELTAETREWFSNLPTSGISKRCDCGDLIVVMVDDTQAKMIEHFPHRLGRTCANCGRPEIGHHLDNNCVGFNPVEIDRHGSNECEKGKFLRCREDSLEG